MRTPPAERAIAIRVLSVLSIASRGVRAEPPEPKVYRIDNYRAPTLATVAGGMVQDTLTADRLWKAGGAVWIDVLPAPHRPANLPLVPAEPVPSYR